jgi:hypothetical protein
MGRTIRKKSRFLTRRKGKSKRGIITNRYKTRFVRRGPPTYSAKPSKYTKAGRSLVRKQQEYARTMRRLFGMPTGSTRRIINNNIIMENAMRAAERQIKEAQVRRSSRLAGKNVEPEALAAAEQIATGKRSTVSRTRKTNVPPTPSPFVNTPTSAYLRSMPSRVAAAPPPVSHGAFNMSAFFSALPAIPERHAAPPAMAPSTRFAPSMYRGHTNNRSAIPKRLRKGNGNSNNNSNNMNN